MDQTISSDGVFDTRKYSDVSNLKVGVSTPSLVEIIEMR